MQTYTHALSWIQTSDQNFQGTVNSSYYKYLCHCDDNDDNDDKYNHRVQRLKVV